MKKYTTEIKWAIVFTVATLVWMYFEKMMGWHGSRIDLHPVYTNIFAVVAIGIYVLALIDKRKMDYKGTMTWRQGFVSGMIISMVVAVLSPLSQLITHKIISPEYFPNAIEHAVSNGKATLQQAEQYFNFGNYVLFSFFSALIMGVVTSAIVAMFVKRS